MALWLGIMRLAERSGAGDVAGAVDASVDAASFFPEVPPEHPAIGSMLMNIAKSEICWGWGNAATPLGLPGDAGLGIAESRCARALATNAMCTFLAINTSGLQLVPVTRHRDHAIGEQIPRTRWRLWGHRMICTACACTAGILMAAFFEQAAGVPAAAGDRTGSGGLFYGGERKPVATTGEKVVVKEAASIQPLQWWGAVIIAGFLLFFVVVFLRLVSPGYIRT